MDRDDYALVTSAGDQNVHVSKTRNGNWEVGMMPNLEPLTSGPPGSRRRGYQMTASGSRMGESSGSRMGESSSG
jgi:hypothetical protein